MRAINKFGRWGRGLRRRSPSFLSTKRRVAVSTAASADDANEVISSTVVSINGTTIGFQSDRLGGVRFPAIEISQGATILAASIQFTATNTDTAAATISIWGEDADDAAAFAAANANISGRTTTTATLSWIVAPWTSGDRGVAQRTPNIAPLVQEIVDRGGWASGQDMAFIFQRTEGQRIFAAHDHATLTEPTITIIWSP